MNRWRARDPVMRFQNLLLASDWWDAEKEKQLRVNLRKEVNHCSELSDSFCIFIHSTTGQRCIEAIKLTAHVFQVLRALDAAQKEPKAPLSDLFTDGKDLCIHNQQSCIL